MNHEEQKQLIDHLADRYVLVPKNKLYWFLGGIFAFILCAFGIGIASVMAYLKTEPAEIARRRILQVKPEVEAHYDALKIDSYVQYGSPVVLQSGTDSKRALNNHSTQAGVSLGGTVVNAQPFDSMNVPSSMKWTVLRP